jgi:class 3 adenylate cyclase
MANETTVTLEAGRDALRRHAWRDAYDLLSEADEGLTASDLEGLAQAAWWTGRMSRSIEAGERAFAAYVKAGNSTRAARVALTLAKDNYTKGSSAAGAAWLARAEKILAAEREAVEHGYLARLKAVLVFERGGDTSEALDHAERAFELGTKFRDRDLQALALNDRGRILLDEGHVAEGMALIDEATVAAVAGELEPLATGLIYCNTISACERIADYARAGEWTEAAKRWCERQAIAGFPGVCRVHRAGIMRLRGAWPEAEEEARRACDELIEWAPGYAGDAFCELGELRLRRGDLVGTEEAFRQASELGRNPQPGLALLRLAQGRLEGALSCIRTALADESRAVVRARLLPARAEIALAAGDLDLAAEAADELDAIAEQLGTAAVDAAAAYVGGLVRLEAGDSETAIRMFRRAYERWRDVDAPYEAARVRLGLGSALLAQGDEETARQHLESARMTFERLGAKPDARRAAEILGSRSAVQAPRAVRTFVFTDICRSTELIDAIGDEAWQDLVRWHDGTLRDLFAEHGGEEVDHAGDGFFVAFPSARSAMDAARAIQRTLAEHRRAHGFAPQVRIGIHEAEAVQDGVGYRGKGVHEAARIAALAEAGEILASSRTVELEGLTEAEPRTVALKGIAEPVDVIPVDWR